VILVLKINKSIQQLVQCGATTAPQTP